MHALQVLFSLRYEQVNSGFRNDLALRATGGGTPDTLSNSLARVPSPIVAPKSRAMPELDLCETTLMPDLLTMLKCLQLPIGYSNCSKYP